MKGKIFRIASNNRRYKITDEVEQGYLYCRRVGVNGKLIGGTEMIHRSEIDGKVYILEAEK